MSVISFSAILFLSAVALALALTPAVRAFARHTGAVDHPDVNRKLHAAPVPKLGGIAIVSTFYLVVFGILPLWDAPAAAAATDLAGRLFFPAILILLLGIADDLWGVKPWMKVAVQIVAALMICWYPDLRIAKMSNPFGITIFGVGILSIPFTIAWIVLITNAFNIVDGVDGLASGVAVIATACLFLAAVDRPELYIPLLVAPLGGALVGFLKYNFAPASIFLGDSGSMSVGFLIAVLSVAAETKSSTAIAVAAPLLSLALPLTETAVSMLRRFLRGQPFWEADSAHIHHQLLKRGLSARRAALLLYGGSALFGVASLLMVDSSRVVGGLVTITLVIAAWLGIQQLGYSEFTEVHHALKRGFLYQRRIIQNSIFVRKLGDDLRTVDTLQDAWPLLIGVVDQLRFARMRLITAAGDSAGDALQDWTADGRPVDGSAADSLRISVHLDVAGQPATRIELWRSHDEDALHSELAALFDVISRELPRIIAGKPSCPGEVGTRSLTFDTAVPGRAVPSAGTLRNGHA
jgi:UDP-GlcNAc:undecaprenyl-phosphate GlcNAc-1-phosphate transferase